MSEDLRVPSAELSIRRKLFKLSSCDKFDAVCFSNSSAVPNKYIPGTAVIKTTRIQEHGLGFGSLV